MKKYALCRKDGSGVVYLLASEREMLDKHREHLNKYPDDFLVPFVTDGKGKVKWADGDTKRKSKPEVVTDKPDNLILEASVE